jgi:hypothetical protein
MLDLSSEREYTLGPTGVRNEIEVFPVCLATVVSCWLRVCPRVRTTRWALKMTSIS